MFGLRTVRVARRVDVKWSKGSIVVVVGCEELLSVVEVDGSMC